MRQQTKTPHHSELASATGNAADERAEAIAAQHWQERFASEILRQRKEALETSLRILIAATCLWGVFALDARAEPRPEATHALVLVLEMPDASTCGEAILKYVGQGDAFCIERGETGASSAPDRSLIPRPRPSRATQE